MVSAINTVITFKLYVDIGFNIVGNTLSLARLCYETSKMPALEGIGENVNAVVACSSKLVID